MNYYWDNRPVQKGTNNISNEILLYILHLQYYKWEPQTIKSYLQYILQMCMSVLISSTPCFWWHDNDRWDYYTTSFFPEAFALLWSTKQGKTSFCPEGEPCFHNRVIWRTIFNKLLLWNHWSEEFSFQLDAEFCLNRGKPDDAPYWISVHWTQAHISNAGFRGMRVTSACPYTHIHTHIHSEAWHPAASLA